MTQSETRCSRYSILRVRPKRPRFEISRRVSATAEASSWHQYASITWPDAAWKSSSSCLKRTSLASPVAASVLCSHRWWARTSSGNVTSDVPLPLVVGVEIAVASGIQIPLPQLDLPNGSSFASLARVASRQRRYKG